MKQVEVQIAGGGKTTLNRNEIVERLADDGNQVRIRLGDGREALVERSALAVFEPC